jgi:transposase
MKIKPKTIKKLPKSSIRIVHPNAAGIDLGSESHFVSVPPDRANESIREFKCFTADLRQMVKFLKDCHIDTVALESTGVYWIPVYDILEENNIEVFLVNARHLKNVPGKKNDADDADWIRELHTFGLLRSSFVPPSEIREARNYWRLRDRHVKSASREILHMQKALDMMNLHLHKVISDLSGTTGMAIIEAILRGERDPKALATYRDSRIRRSEEEIALSLEGNYQETHLFELSQSLDSYKFYQRKIAECDSRLENLLQTYKKKVNSPLPKTLKKQRRHDNAPRFNVQDLLYQIYGVDLTQIHGVSYQTALTIFSEVGTDFSKFKTEKHFASWAGLSPNKKISGGKTLSSRTQKSNNKVANALRVAASTLLRTDCALGAFYRSARFRLGPAKAKTATARKLACLIYRMVTKGQEYCDIGAEKYEQKIKERQVRNLKKRAQNLGFQLTEIAA